MMTSRVIGGRQGRWFQATVPCPQLRREPKDRKNQNQLLTNGRPSPINTLGLLSKCE